MPASNVAQDTYTWLVTTEDACPICGAPVAPDAAACPVCGYAMVVTVRPPERSQALFTLTGAWAIGAVVAALVVVVGVMQLTGMMPAAEEDRRAMLWLAPASLALGVFGVVMAWACWGRRPFAFYTGIALVALFGLAGIGGALVLGGMLALSVVIISILAASGLILLHLSAAREFRGERRRRVFETRGKNGREFYLEGREHYEAGRRFLAAQRWARAIGREPAKVEYIHALALVLAQLGYHERALDQIERALRIAPGDPQVQESYRLIRSKQFGTK
jgi:hypothetical protein